MGQSAKNTPVRFALVGCGTIAKTQIRALRELGECAGISVLADSQPERAAAMAKEFGLESAGFEAICQESAVDAVTICTPSGRHAELAVRALEAGKHVIVEKPMDVTVEACRRMREAARRSDRRLGVVSQHRFDPSSEVVRGALEADKLGRMIFAEARIPWYRSQDYYDSGEWRGTLAIDGGGCLMNQGIHTVDLMLWLAGPATRVRAIMGTVAHERIEVEDLITVQVEFASGAMGSVVGSTALYPGFPATLGIHGTKGSAVVEGDALKTLAVQGEETLHGDGANAHALQVASGGTRSANSEIEAGRTSEWKWGDAHRAQFVDFVAAIREGREPLSDGLAGLRAVAFIKACYRSAETGDWESVGEE